MFGFEEIIQSMKKN